MHVKFPGFVLRTFAYDPHTHLVCLHTISSLTNCHIVLSSRVSSPTRRVLLPGHFALTVTLSSQLLLVSISSYLLTSQALSLIWRPPLPLLAPSKQLTTKARPVDLFHLFHLFHADRPASTHSNFGRSCYQKPHLTGYVPHFPLTPLSLSSSPSPLPSLSSPRHAKLILFSRSFPSPQELVTLTISTHYQPRQVTRLCVELLRLHQPTIYSSYLKANMPANFRSEEGQRRLLTSVLAAHPELRLNYKGRFEFLHQRSHHNHFILSHLPLSSLPKQPKVKSNLTSYCRSLRL